MNIADYVIIIILLTANLTHSQNRQFLFLPIGDFVVLTLSWPGKILLHPKIRCFNFKPQYLLNYTSPTNDLYSVRKRSIGAFKSIFKLLGLGPASAGPLRAKFFARSSPLACGFAALAPNFAPKLCTRRVSACFSTCFKTCWGRFDPMLIPVK